MPVEIPIEERSYKDTLIDIRTWKLPTSGNWTGWFSVSEQVGDKVKVRLKWGACCNGHDDESEAAYHALDVAKQKLDVG